MSYNTGWTVLLTLFMVLLGIALLGCPKRPEVAQAGPAVAGPGGACAAHGAPAPSGAVPAASLLKGIFFDLAKASFGDDQKVALSDDLAWLKGTCRAKIPVEGYCNEQGPIEYSLALGGRRAKTGKDSPVAAGIAADRTAIISSSGRERPFVLGQDEGAWKWNRRGCFVTTAVAITDAIRQN